MKLPFASMLLLKIFLLSILSITTNGRINSKLHFEICPKTKNPEKCLEILAANRNTRLASTLHGLGLGSLAMAKVRSRLTAEDFKHSTVQTDLTKVKPKDMAIYKECQQNYEVATKKLRGAYTAWIAKKYPVARNGIEFARKMRIPCEKALAGASQNFDNDELKRGDHLTDINTDIALVIANEIEGNKK
ncbi:hypothetical protein ACP275_09G054800 [Erythranthe tilingii]